MYTHMYAHINVYIYIYIERERYIYLHTYVMWIMIMLFGVVSNMYILDLSSIPYTLKFIVLLYNQVYLSN